MPKKWSKWPQILTYDAFRWFLLLWKFFEIVTKNWAIFGEKTTYSFFRLIFWKTLKIAVLSPKIAQFFTKVSQNLQIDKKHLNASYVKILGHLDHFFCIYGSKWQFWGHLPSPLLIQNFRKYTHWTTCTHCVYICNFWTARPILKCLGILKMAYEGLIDRI